MLFCVVDKTLDESLFQLTNQLTIDPSEARTERFPLKASRYVLYMQNKEQLIAQVEAVLIKWHNKDEITGGSNDGQ